VLDNERPADEQLPHDRSLDRIFLPPLVDEWMPETHLARFVVEVIDGLNLCVTFTTIPALITRV
jgi:hypothetical protein